MSELVDARELADFALWATAAESGLGLQPGEFLTAYRGNGDTANKTALESSPVAKIQEWLKLGQHGMRQARRAGGRLPRRHQRPEASAAHLQGQRRQGSGRDCSGAGRRRHAGEIRDGPRSASGFRLPGHPGGRTGQADKRRGTGNEVFTRAGRRQEALPVVRHGTVEDTFMSAQCAPDNSGHSKELCHGQMCLLHPAFLPPCGVHEGIARAAIGKGQKAYQRETDQLRNLDHLRQLSPKKCS